MEKDIGKQNENRNFCSSISSMMSGSNQKADDTRLTERGYLDSQSTKNFTRKKNDRTRDGNFFVNIVKKKKD